MFETLRMTFENWINERSLKDRVVTNLLIKCNHTLKNRPNYCFALHREDTDEQSVWVGFDETYREEDFEEQFDWLYSQLN